MEWKEYSLGDISKLKYGKNVSAKLCKGPVPIFSGYRKIGTCNTINCKKNTVIVIARGAGGCGDVKLTKEDCFLTNLSISVELDKGICNAKWFYYNHLLNNLSFLNSGSAQPQITIDSLSKYLIRIPPIIIQRKIAGILSALDAKIENNNKINANLEAQAEALFKSWFVDFTPFKDQPFVDSELGPIPQGWKVGKLGDIGEIVGGSTPSKSKPEYYTTHGIAWLTPKDLSTSKAKFTSRGEIDITDEGYNSTSTKLMPRGSVLFSSRAPIGYLTIAKNEICTNQGFKSLVPNGAGTGFIYYTLRHLTPQIENRATGSTFKEASATLMRSVETIVPPTSILNKFEELLRPILQFQEKKEEENQRLAALRDTLLPKLMSGEIKL